MIRDPQVLIKHILESIDSIEKFTINLTEEEFVANELVAAATTRKIEIIGEAARFFPTDFKDSHPEIPWLDIMDTRNRLIHEYFGVDLELVWEIVKKDLPELKEQLKKL